MKNLAKVLAVILALAMITVFATSCGSSSKNTGSSLSSLKDRDDKDKDDDEDKNDDKSSEKDEEDEDEEEDDSSTSTGLFSSVEDYLKSDIGKKEIDSVIEAYEDSFDIEIYAEDNDMFYDYTYITQYDESTAEILKDTLEEGLESQASTFESVVEMMEDCVIGDVTLTVIYRNADGTLLTERTFY